MTGPIKKSIARVYEADAFVSLFGGMLHPGGQEITERVVELAEASDTSRILDIACGEGKTAHLLAKKYGCLVAGADLSRDMIDRSCSKTKAEGLGGEASFIVADAEESPFLEDSFDVVISECSFSILPDKRKAALEIKRTLKPGGKLIITDIILRGDIQSETKNYLAVPFQELFPLFPCVLGAKTTEGYTKLFEGVGFENPHIEEHSKQLRKLNFQMGLKFGGWEGFFQKLTSEISQGQGEEGFSSSAETYRKIFEQGKPGYALIMMNKPENK